MKYLLTEEKCTIPEKVSVKSKARIVEVTGPRGTIKKNFKHVPIDIFVGKDKKNVNLQMWLSKRKQRCKVRSVASIKFHIKIVKKIPHMIRGVTTGYKFKMRYAYAHFPIQGSVTDKGKQIEIRNFLGEKVIRKIKCLGGVTASVKESEKDTITVVGNDLENVSLTCALVQQSCRIKNKDIRQFLDGVYVSEKRLEDD